MATAYQDNLERERAYARECIEAGRECLTARAAARLFGVHEGAIRVAKHDGRLRPAFVLAVRDLPIFRLADLRDYFAGRAAPDPALLDTMRSHGPTCFIGSGGGGWVLLTERPGLRTWDEAVDVRTQVKVLAAERGTTVAVGLDDLLNALLHEWADGFDRLNEFEQLFGEAEHVELLNLVGGTFFGDVQQVLWDDQLLRVTRLTDPKQTGPDRANDNLTVERLLDFCESHDELRKEVKEQVKAARRAAKVARSHRNKRISHKDLAFAIGGRDLPLTTLRQIREALDAVHAALQTVSLKLRCQYLPKETIDRRPGGVVAFLHRIQVLVDAGLCVEGLLAHLSDQAPPWDEDVARDCIRRLGGTPSPEKVQRIVNLRVTAARLRTSTT